MAVTLRHLKKVRAAYYPFDDAARSCKEFLRRVSCETVRSTNPKCEIQAEVMQDPRAAQLALTFSACRVVSVVLSVAVCGACSYDHADVMHDLCITLDCFRVFSYHLDATCVAL